MACARRKISADRLLLLSHRSPLSDLPHHFVVARNTKYLTRPAHESQPKSVRATLREQFKPHARHSSLVIATQAPCAHHFACINFDFLRPSYLPSQASKTIKRGEQRGTCPKKLSLLSRRRHPSFRQGCGTAHLSRLRARSARRARRRSFRSPDELAKSSSRPTRRRARCSRKSARAALSCSSAQACNSKTNAAVFEQGGYVLSTPLRMDADERFTGRGVTMAFLDSGFYPHHDLTKPQNRILAYHSLVAAEGDKTTLETPDPSSWHGMMTSVVAAGNGGLSNGFYRGIAPDAKVVLVKLARIGPYPRTRHRARHRMGHGPSRRVRHSHRQYLCGRRRRAVLSS